MAGARPFAEPSELLTGGLESSSVLCARLKGYDLHAAARAGAEDDMGREALLRYVLRAPIAQERVVQGPDGLVRIVLKKRFSDGTLAVDMDSRATI